MSQALTPYLVSNDAAATIEFYKRAFGAEEVSRHAEPNGKRIMHAHLNILGSDLMLSDDFSDKMGGKSQTPADLGGSPVTLHLEVPDANAFWAQAVAAGATVTMPLKDQFWGERYGQLKDPFGHKWSIGQMIKTVSQEELLEGAKAAF
jgi:PhnB protein